MLAQFHAIQMHLWVLTVLLAVLVTLAGYCNYSRLKEQAKPKAFAVMKSMWDRGNIEDLLEYTTTRLRELPNSGETLFYYAMALIRIGRLDEARVVAVRLVDTQPEMARQAKELLFALDSRPAG